MAKTCVKKEDAKKEGAKKTCVKKSCVKKSPILEEIASRVDRPRVLFVSAEVNPFSQTGGLGEVAGSLPTAVNASGKAEVAVITPLYECIGREWRDKFTFVCDIIVPVAWRKQYAGLFRFEYRGVIHYFIDNEYYFKRQGLYGHGDDVERFAFFTRAVLELMPYMDFKPNIIHSNDWHSALVPTYYKMYYKDKMPYKNIKQIITVHNIEYQGACGGYMLEDVLGISGFEYYTLEWGGNVNILYGAMLYSDLITTVSRTYARELCTEEHGCGLDVAVQKFSDKLTGIVNGIDVEVYNPATASALAVNYDAQSFDKKVQNKLALQKELGLSVSANTPMITMVTRLASHKGLDVLCKAIRSILEEDVQFVLLGTGAPEYEGFFMDLERACPDKLRALIKFDKTLSQKLFASGDIYMMPSRSEPCGLGQMMAMRYGTVPIVRNVGGLNDTVTEGKTGNGFVATEHTAESLYDATLRALKAYRNADEWKEIALRGMQRDWSWNASAKEYIELYKNLLK